MPDRCPRCRRLRRRDLERERRKDPAYRQHRNGLLKASRDQRLNEVREQARRYMHNRRVAGGMRVLPGIEDLLMEAQRGRCANPFCRGSLKESRSLDHIVAVTRGGSNATSNLQLLCGSCNSAKYNKTYGEFLEDQR